MLQSIFQKTDCTLRVRKSKNGIRYKWQRYIIDRCRLCFTDIIARVKIGNENRNTGAGNASVFQIIRKLLYYESFICGV